MIKFENTEVIGWEHAIRGMRNPLNSWDKSDTEWVVCEDDNIPDQFLDIDFEEDAYKVIGENDLDLMQRLRNAGTDHRKYLRMIAVYVDITAPLYWWKEFDTYVVGVVKNSCSTMHKITSKEITLDDFSMDDFCMEDEGLDFKDYFINVVADCESLREKYLETGDKRYWRGLIQLLPSGYNQKRTVMMNYEVLNNIYKSRKNHKLIEWSEEFMNWIESLPYSKELIIGGD